MSREIAYGAKILLAAFKRNSSLSLKGRDCELAGEVKYVYLPGREDREIFLEVERCRW
jgi:hypothetical protein